ncbi:hypothetical protein DZ860_09015 [Vibrio sinensis]|uniref:DUF3131 domain-containing protein n=1 Tax=Vibrio sinensis TaxID=2302434 RepID=A0A3A6R4R9_9VIBR|nr:hypothetical protein [Vibrio sinensis]RJX71962.1 hypothetical protein DZ860_09015 [Vibrio sinensis]
MRKSIIALNLLFLFGCNGGGDSATVAPEIPVEDVIRSINIDEKYYPESFAQSLQDNMDYFLDGVGVSTRLKLPYDHVLVQGSSIAPSSYTNISTVALYINLLVEMVDAGDEAASKRLDAVLTQLEVSPKWNGLFYWLYDMSGSALAVSNSATVSAVDNGIMSFSLAGLNGAFDNHSDERLNRLAQRAQSLLEKQVIGWQSLYDPNRGLLHAGWSRTSNSLLGYHIDRKANESRLAPLWAVMVSEGTIPETAFTDMELLVGEYTMDSHDLTPMLTWDGSYFQAFLPALWLDEQRLIPNDQMMDDFTEVHKQYADLHRIPFVSASATVDDGYAAFGVQDVSESYRKFGNEIETGTTGSPHTLGLYYMQNPSDALARLNQLRNRSPQIQTQAGWADAIDANGHVSSKVIGLDQGMFIGAFFADSVRENVERYLTRKGYQTSLTSMYTDFIPNETVTHTP